MGDHHPCYPHPERSWREGPPHSRADRRRPEALRIPSRIRRALRREGSVPWSVRCRACYGVIRNVMESGAQGVEVVVSGKLRGQRAKAMIFTDGYMIKAGNPCRHYIEKATRHVLLRQGCVGIKIEIMLPHDPQGKAGPKKPMPDFVEVFEPKDDVVVAAPVKGSEE